MSGKGNSARRLHRFGCGTGRGPAAGCSRPTRQGHSTRTPVMIYVSKIRIMCFIKYVHMQLFCKIVVSDYCKSTFIPIYFLIMREVATCRNYN